MHVVHKHHCHIGDLARDFRRCFQACYSLVLWFLGFQNYDHLFAIEAHLEAEESAAKRLLLD